MTSTDLDGEGSSAVARAPSWRQRHRLGQLRIETADHISRPHHTWAAYRVQGDLDVAALETAWSALQRRHGVLRSRFDLTTDTWLPAATEPVGVEMYRVRSTAEAENEVLSAVERLFPVQAGPLARLVLVHGPGEFHIALAVDHLVCDAWSSSLLVRELGELYSGTLEGLPAPGPDFVELARRESAYLDSADGRRSERDEIDRISEVGPLPAMPLPGFSGAARARYDRTAAVRTSIAADLAVAVAQTAAAHRVSRWELLHASVHRAIHDLTGLATVATVVFTANRTPETSGTVGWLADKLVVVSRPGETDDCRDLLKQIRLSTAQAVDASSIPWPYLVAKLAPQQFGRHSQSPYIAFNPRATGRSGAVVPAFSDSDVQPVRPASKGTPDPAMVINVVPSGDTVDAVIFHRTDWYAATAIEAFWSAIEENLRRWCP